MHTDVSTHAPSDPAKVFPACIDAAITRRHEQYARGETPVARLGHVQRVQFLLGSHKTDTVFVGGLRFAGKMGEFEEGQLVLIFEAYAFLPNEAHRAFSDLRARESWDGDTGFKVRYQMINGLQCQGILMAVEKFAKVMELLIALTDWFGGDRVAAEEELCNMDIQILLGVRRWAPKTTMATGSIGKPPTFFRRPAIRRLAECPNLFTKLKYFRFTYQESVKMDGSSMAVYFVSNDSPFFKSLNPLPSDPGPNMVLSNGRVGVCSMNSELDEGDISAYWKVALKYNLPTILNEQNMDWVIQGELVGHGVCGNRHGYPKGEHDFFAFDIWEPRVEKNWLGARRVEAWCRKHGVQHVPARGYYQLRKISNSHEQLQQRADKVDGEGLVYKCLDDPARRFKVHNRNYLADYGLE